MNITIDDVANDGAAGENDNVKSTIEVLVSGRGDDTIVGPPDRDVILTGFIAAQHRGEPAARRAHACQTPPPRWWNRRWSRLPSCPEELRPQQRTVPSVIAAHE